MDAKQLQETGRQLVKAFEGGDPPSTLLNLLTSLEKWKATEDLLRQTKLGVMVAKLKGSKDAKVSEAARLLINKWKAEVNKSKKAAAAAAGGGGGSPAQGQGQQQFHHAGKSGSPPGVNGVTATMNGRSGTSSPAPKKETIAAPPPPQPKKFTAAPEKRSAKEDGVDTAITGNSARDGCITLIYNGLAFLSHESPDDILSVSRRVELAAWETHGSEASNAYKAKMRSLHLNLKMKPNVGLRRDVFNGAIAPGVFVNMTSDELKSEDKRESDAALQKENMRVSMTPQEEKAISTTMTCGKCRQNKVSYSQAQTRSADEPMTTFCECMNCGNRWKFS